MAKPKAIAVVGPTSSGKTSLSIEIAKNFAGDVADPMTTYTASEFEMDATAAIMDIRSRNHLPIVAGGTFFYLDMLRGKQSVAHVPPNKSFRLDMTDFSTPELFSKLEISDPERASSIDRYNRPRLIRALEIIESLGKVPKVEKSESPFDWLVIGIDVDKLRLHDNIHCRLHQRLEDGMVNEVEQLNESGLTFQRMHDLGLEYRYVSMYIRNELTYQEMVEELEAKIRQFAKRQMTWLKRDKEIEWFKPENREAIFTRVGSFLKDNNS
jgi:tRNA dimethylallyltransferase